MKHDKLSMSKAAPKVVTRIGKCLWCRSKSLTSSRNCLLVLKRGEGRSFHVRRRFVSCTSFGVGDRDISMLHMNIICLNSPVSRKRGCSRTSLVVSFPTHSLSGCSCLRRAIALTAWSVVAMAFGVRICEQESCQVFWIDCGKIG